MTSSQVMALRPGDEVYWNDPDEGLCSRPYKIQSVGVSEQEKYDIPLHIVDVSGDVLECFASELS